MTEAAWRQRYRAGAISLPQWARDAPGRASYASTVDGTVDWYAWDQATGSHHTLRRGPETTRIAVLDATGKWVWWFDDNGANDEGGRWLRRSFSGPEDQPVVLPRLQPTGLALGSDFTVVSGAFDNGFAVWVMSADGHAEVAYRDERPVTVGDLSTDDAYFVIAHSENGDSDHRALRVLTIAGQRVAELWDGPGQGVGLGRWSPLPGDCRLIVYTQRVDGPPLAIWTPAADTVTPIDVDLPGDVLGTWYPDADALLLN